MKKKQRNKTAVLSIKYHSIVKVHSFYANLPEKILSFNIVQDFDVKKQEREKKALLAEIEKEFPDMKVNIYTSLNA